MGSHRSINGQGAWACQGRKRDYSWRIAATASVRHGSANFSFVGSGHLLPRRGALSARQREQCNDLDSRRTYGPV